MTNSAKPARRPFRLFSPILAGATLKERLIACVGALLGIGLTGLICGQFVGHAPSLPLIVAPIGASAVLVFAIPASPLAQPWPVIGGNTISAIIGVAVAYVVHDTGLAIGIAVALALIAMSFTRSLHPPGGAAALLAALAGPATTSSGFLFPLVPVALNSAMLVAVGLIFHKMTGRNYPHKPAPLPAAPKAVPQIIVGFEPEDVDAALAVMHETFDIDRTDLDRLLREVERQALMRSEAAASGASR